MQIKFLVLSVFPSHNILDMTFFFLMQNKHFVSYKSSCEVSAYFPH